MTKFIFNPFTNNLDAVSVANPAGNSLDFLTGNSGGTVPADSGNNINILGDSDSGINVVGSPGSSTLTIFGLPSSTVQVGTTRYATDAEAAAQTITNAALTPSNITSFFSVNPLPPSQGGALSLLGTPNQINVIISPSTASFELTNGISIGSFQLTAPPTGGMLIPGQVSIGSNTPPTNPKLYIDSSSSVYAIDTDGTQTLKDSNNNQIGINASNNFSPTGGATTVAQVAANINVEIPAAQTAGLACAYYGSNIFTSNVGTVTRSIVYYADGGVAATGTVIDAYGGFFSNPAFATNRVALYAANLAIGITSTAPPVNGARIVGSIRNDALSAFSTVASDANKNLVSIANNTSGFVLTSNGAGAIPTFQSFTPSGTITGTANQISVTTVGSNNTLAFTNGISIGSFQASTPPVGGMLIPGTLSVASVVPDTRANFYIGGTNIYGYENAGNRDLVDSSNNQIGTFSTNFFFPTSGSNVSSEFSASPRFNIPTGQTVNLATSYIGTNSFPANLGTITDSAIFYSNNPAGSTTGTIVNAYGAYFNAPNYGTNRIAAYADNLSIGAPGVVPPSTGARILGNILNDALTAFEVVAADTSKNLSSIANNTAGFLLTSNGAGSQPTFQVAPVGVLEGVARYVVSPNLSQGGGYTSIQAAITQAVSDGASAVAPAVVWIWPGIYTEDLTLTSFVSLASAQNGVAGVTIKGSATYTPGAANETFDATNITFQTAGATPAFSILGDPTACRVTFNTCTIQGFSGDAVNCNNGNAVILFSSSQISANSGFKCFDVINSAAVEFLYCFVVSVDTPSTIAGTGSFDILSTAYTDTIAASGNAIIIATNSVLQSLSGQELINLGVTAQAYVINCPVESDNPSGFWATGTGTISASSVSTGLNVGSAIDPSLTIISQLLQIGKLVSTPSDSNSVTTAFGTSLTTGTAVQNTTGSNILVNICVEFSSAIAGVIVMGVAPGPTPATNPITSAITTVSTEQRTFSAHVPANYYLLVDTTGTMTVTSITTQAMGI